MARNRLEEEGRGPFWREGLEKQAYGPWDPLLEYVFAGEITRARCYAPCRVVPQSCEERLEQERGDRLIDHSVGAVLEQMNEARFGEDTVGQYPAAGFNESLLKLQYGIWTDLCLSWLRRRNFRGTGS